MTKPVGYRSSGRGRRRKVYPITPRGGSKGEYPNTPDDTRRMIAAEKGSLWKDVYICPKCGWTLEVDHAPPVYRKRCPQCGMMVKGRTQYKEKSEVSKKEKELPDLDISILQIARDESYEIEPLNRGLAVKAIVYKDGKPIGYGYFDGHAMTRIKSLEGRIRKTRMGAP